MGAKQSKRSVDISGKEAEGAGEVAAAGAGGEGRVEAIDVDNLKPQLNGDAQHIEPPQEKTEKEKQLDSSTPENEKDATTEKESESEKKDAPLTNGESEHKPEAEKENGETPATEEKKKPKKEKVKKKFSLRSISFSRKDKPKQEKKEKKEEEAKTNGEAEKLPEEAAEATEVATGKQAPEETKPAETKDEKTPVTEPITNGTSTPETPKVESPAEPAPQVTDRPETKTVTEPEELPLNGLSLEESIKEVTEVAETVESKIEELVAPAPETPAKTEVCVERMSSIDSTPPPLPANPPPSSVASFAATTMAPELTDASLINTTESALPAPPITEAEPPTASQDVIAKTETIITESVITTEPIIVEQLIKDDIDTETIKLSDAPITESVEINDAPAPAMIDVSDTPKIEAIEISDAPETDLVNKLGNEYPDMANHNNESGLAVLVEDSDEIITDAKQESSPELDTAPKTPQQKVEDEIGTEVIISDIIEQNGDDSAIDTHLNGDHISNGFECDKMNGHTDDIQQENIKNKTKDTLTNSVEKLNGSFEPSAATEGVKCVKALVGGMGLTAAGEEALPPPEEDAEAPSSEEESSFPPPPPADAPSAPQEITSAHEKMADLIPEIPDLPTETMQETTRDVAVAE